MQLCLQPKTICALFILFSIHASPCRAPVSSIFDKICDQKARVLGTPIRKALYSERGMITVQACPLT